MENSKEEDSRTFLNKVREFISCYGLTREYIDIVSVDYGEDVGWQAIGEGKFGDYTFECDEDGEIVMDCLTPIDSEEFTPKHKRSFSEILFDVTWETAYLLHAGLFDDVEWPHDEELYEYCLEIAEDFQDEFPFSVEDDGYLDNVVRFTRSKLLD